MSADEGELSIAIILKARGTGTALLCNLEVAYGVAALLICNLEVAHGY